MAAEPRPSALNEPKWRISALAAPPLGEAGFVLTLLDRISDGLFLLDMEWRFVYANAQAGTLLGRSHSHLIGHSLRDLFPESGSTPVDLAFHKVQETNKQESAEWFCASTGKWLAIQIYPEPDGVSAFLQDITEQKQKAHAALDAERDLLEQQLRNSVVRLNAIVDTAVDAIIAIDEQGFIETFNHAAELTFGYESAEVIGKNVKLLMPEPYRSAHDEYLQNYHRTGERKIIGIGREVRGRRKDGSEFPMDLSVSETIVDGCRVYTGIVRDVTDRRVTEMALRESEERYRSLVQATAAIVWNTPASGEFEPPLPKWSAFTGQGSEEYQGWGWLHAVHPEDRANTARLWSLAVASQTSYQVEHRLRRYDGLYRHMLARAVPIKDPEGNIREWIGVHTDVSELKRAEQEVRRLNLELERRVEDRTVELQEANRELEGFCYSVSHDFRTPLRAIVSSSRILLEDLGPRLTSEEKHKLERQAAAATKLGQLVDELLEFSRLGRREIQKSKFNLSLLASEVGEEVLARREDGRITLQVDESIRAFGDPMMIRLVLQNLIENAIKFSPGGGTVHVGNYLQDGEPVYFVRDEGIGFDMKFVHKLFLPFERLHRDQDFPGTGIGLANVQRIVARHEGRVWAEGQPGKGSTFFFTFGR